MRVHFRASVIMTGIRPEVAQALVGMGVDLRRIDDTWHAARWYHPCPPTLVEMCAQLSDFGLVH